MKATVDWNKSAAASREIIDFLVGAYRDERGVHTETVIGAAAALAGSYALRSVGAVAPGLQYIVSPKVTELLLTGGGIGNSLTGIILQFAEAAGAPKNKLPNPVAVNAQMVGAFNSPSYPPLSVPQANYPREWSPNATVRLRPAIGELLARHRLNPTEAAVALATAAGGLVKITAAAIDPLIAATLAIEIMIGVSKMRPLDREIGTAPPTAG